jgi:uncharacterized membrane protein
MQKIFGLPAHPLMVHLPVVLVPLVAVAAIVLALRRDLRQRFGTALIAASALSCVAIFLAKESGEGMFVYMNQAPAISRHQSLAKVTVILTFLLFIAIVVMVVAHRKGKARPRSRTAVALSSVTIALALLAFVGIIQTGHEGAKVTWQSGKAGG